MSALWADVPARTLAALAVLALLLMGAPFAVNGYILSVLTIVLYLAFTGQAWNLMLGFAGLLSAVVRALAPQTDEREMR